MQPPRALWVPFELGRPLGVPGDTAFQTRVTLATLDLLEAPSGPILVDYQEEAPAAPEAPEALVCPVNFSGATAAMSSFDQLRSSLRQEMTLLRPWYDQAVAKRGRTTVGVSELTPEEICDYIGGFLDNPAPAHSNGKLQPAVALRLAAEDLKAYYSEAITSQPGQEAAESTTISNWFWRETVASQVLFQLRETYQDSDDDQLRRVAQGNLVPRAYHAESSQRIASA